MQKVDGLRRLESYLRSTTPIRHQRLKSTNAKQGFASIIDVMWEVFPNLEIAEVLIDKDNWSEMEIEKHATFLNSLVNIHPIIDEEYRRLLEINAHHLSVALSLPFINDFLSSLTPEDREQEQAVVEISFSGNESISIDTDLNDIIFHGVNLTFAANKIHIGKCEAENKMIHIDVSGLNGEEHPSTKPPTPGAFGTKGKDGLHGNPGENGGHIFIKAYKELHGLHFLEIISTGGNGGKGQDGGDGSNGVDGTSGLDGVISDTSPTAKGCRFEHGVGEFPQFLLSSIRYF